MFVLHMHKTRAQISCAVIVQMISPFVLAAKIFQSIYFLNMKIQAYSHLLWLYSPVCVGLVGTPEDRFFGDVAHFV